MPEGAEVQQPNFSSQDTKAPTINPGMDKENRKPDLTDKDITGRVMTSKPFYCDPQDPNLTLYVYHEGIWAGGGIAEGQILQTLTKIFEDYDSRAKMQVQKVTDFIKGSAMDRILEDLPPHLIPFNNGLYSLKTKKLQLFEAKYRAFNKLPHDFDPTAKCPEWEKWLGEVLYPEDLPFIQEWVGYNLYIAYPEASFLILTGSGQNGKTIFMDLLVYLLGDRNVTSVSLADLTYNDFSPADLYHKLANISDDIGNQAIRDAGILKMVSSGSRINAQRKFGHPFDYRPYAKITYSCNEPPEIRDESDAIKHRIKFIEFPYTFAKIPGPDQKQARDRREILETLKKEAPGILNWALVGLERFLNNGSRFSTSRSTDETWLFYKRRSNPILCFLDECLEFTDNEEDAIEKDHLYKVFQEWIKTTKMDRIVTRDRFFKDLRKQGFEARQSKAYDMKRLYFGYRIKEGNKVTTFTPSPVRKKLDSIVEDREESNSKPCYSVTSQSPDLEGRDFEHFTGLALDLNDKYPEGFETKILEDRASQFGFAQDFTTKAITLLLDENKFFMPRPEVLKKV